VRGTFGAGATAVRIVDISLPLGRETPAYPGDPRVDVERLREARGGDTYALSRLTLGSHAGTHVDPPAHFLPGAPTAERIPLDACIGPAVVLNVQAGADLVAVDELAPLPEGADRVLLRTGCPPLGGRALSLDAAHDLVRRGIRLVGIDALSIAPADAPGAVHRVLLAAGIVILEGLDLSAAAPGPATLLCLPLKLTGGDGAPARAVLVYDE
jgi:arylformamidase